MTVDEFGRILATGHVYRSLFHFTDEENLVSISAHGILSKDELARRNLEIPVPGGNDWSHEADTIKGLNDYVNLCFTTSHPLCYIAQQEGRVSMPRYLHIDVEVLRIPGVKITIGVANKSETELLDIEQGLDQLDKEVLYRRTDWHDPEVQARLQLAEKCEILVPKEVPTNLIVAIS